MEGLNLENEDVQDAAGPLSETSTLREALPSVDQPPARAKHQMYYFPDDILAQTTDPEVMKLNYRIPLKYLMKAPEFSELVVLSEADLKEEIILSRTFLMSFPNGKEMTECLDKFDYCSGMNRNLPNRTKRPVIKRTKKWTAKFEVVPRKDPLRSVLESSREIKKSKDADKLRPLATSTSFKNQIGKTTIVAGEDIYHPIQLDSLTCLRPSADLNDEVFEYGLVKAINSCDDLSTKGVYYATLYGWTSYWSKDNHGGTTVDKYYRLISKKAPEKDLLKINYLFLPVLTEKHWLLIIVCNPFPSEEDIDRMKETARKENAPLSVYSQSLYADWKMNRRNTPAIVLLDSLYQKLQNKGFTNYHGPQINRIWDGLYHLHKKLWEDSSRNFGFKVELENISTGIRYWNMDVPGQTDRHNCGVYCMQYAKMWLTEAMKVNGDYMTLLLSDTQKMFSPYAEFFNRYKLLRIIHKEAKNKSRDHAKAVKKVVRKFYPKRSWET